MKIAALIQAHHRPEQLARLLDRLSGELWAPYVHVDRKSDIRTFAPLQDKATFLDQRIKVYWGGMSQVRAALLLLRAAYRDPAITHFYHMSGQCFPVKSDAQIIERIGALPEGSANFMTRTIMPVSHKPLYRYTRRRFFDVGNPLARKVLNRLFSYVPDRSLEDLRGIVLQGGSSWWLLERQAVGKILRFIDDNPWYVRLFLYSTSPDEMFFHSLVDSVGVDVGETCPTASKWIQGRDNPEIIDDRLQEEFIRGTALFARKY